VKIVIGGGHQRVIDYSILNMTGVYVTVNCKPYSLATLHDTETSLSCPHVYRW